MSGRSYPSWPGWHTVRKIGQGSFGSVYEIEREIYGHTEKAALKVISIPHSEGEIAELQSDGYDEQSITQHLNEQLQEIIREYSLMAEMKGCANIVYCDDLRSEKHNDDQGWDVLIKMELLMPLTKANQDTIDDEKVVKIGTDLCNALVYCEKHNILHRDIKPQNVFVSPDGTYKLGDFGIAKIADHTTAGTRIGTLRYMAPEVYSNQPYGVKADIYSLGLVLYWLLNERRMPFLPLPPELPSRMAEEKAFRLRYTGEAIPKPAHGSEMLKRIVLKACAYDPKDRYQNAAEMLADLNAIGREGTVPIRPPVPEPAPTPPQPSAPTPPAQRKPWLLWVCLSLGVICLAGLALFLGLGLGRSERSALRLTDSGSVQAISSDLQEQPDATAIPLSPAADETPIPTDTPSPIIAEPHWSAPVYIWAQDNNSVTAKRVNQNEPSQVETETVLTSSKVTRSPTCLDYGETTYIAVFTNAAFEEQSNTLDNIAPLGHDWVQATDSIPAACTRCGAQATPTYIAYEQELITLSPFSGNLSSFDQVYFSDAAASSVFTEGNGFSYPAKNVIKEKMSWPWVEGNAGDGTGEYIVLSFDNPEKLDVLALHLGFKSVYAQNNRPRLIQFDFSDATSVQFEFDDINQMQYVQLSHAVTTSYVKITILSVYPSHMDNDACISAVRAYRERSS